LVVLVISVYVNIAKHLSTAVFLITNRFKVELFNHLSLLMDGDQLSTKSCLAKFFETEKMECTCDQVIGGVRCSGETITCKKEILKV